MTINPVLNDGFEGLPVGRGWLDGSLHGNWIDVFGGGGNVGIESVTGRGNVLSLTPGVATSAGLTHSSLVRTTKSFGDFDSTHYMRTVSQVRTGSPPNVWETAWALWHYTDNTHFYYFIIKTTGWEFGKEDPAYPGAQRIIASGPIPFVVVGQWYLIRIRQVSNVMTVWVDGNQVFTYTDTERPYLYGSHAAYTEDAYTQFDNVIVQAVGRLDVFPIGSGGNLWQLTSTDEVWSPWQLLGPVVDGSAAVVTPGGVAFDVYYTNPTSHVLNRKLYRNGVWTTDVPPLGGYVIGGPAVARMSDSRTDVFVRGSDSQLWQATLSGSSWGPWKLIAGATTHSPGACSWGANRLDVVFRVSNGNTWHGWWTGTTWNWENLGGYTGYAPAIHSMTPGKLDVFVTGGDSQVYQQTFINGAWSGWGSLQGTATSGPSASSWSNNRIDLFVRGPDGALWQKTWDGNGPPTPWTSRGGGLAQVTQSAVAVKA